MKLTRIIFLLLLLALSIVLPLFINSTLAEKLVDQVKTKPLQINRDGLSQRVSLRAAGRGNPWINIKDGRDLLTEYDAPEFNRRASEGAMRALSLASADFDEDGVPDLISGYGGDGDGLITLHRGNIDSIYPNSPEAKQREARGGYTDSPFLSPARVFAVPEPPDFIASGDFDGDSHWDVVTAARGSEALYLLSGDGHSNLGQPQKIAISGQVTAMVCGDINRPDGLNDLVVAITGEQGQRALVFESPEGALRGGEPETIALPAEAHALAIGQLDEKYEYDLAVAAGSELMIVQGRDRKLSLDEMKRATTTAAKVYRISLPSKIKSMAIGNFASDYRAEVALLDETGKAYLVSRKNKRQTFTLLAKETFVSTSQLISAKVSSLPHDDLVLIDEQNKQLHILIDSQPDETLELQSASSSLRPFQAITLDAEDAPVAVLPMRLNGDALSDLVILNNGEDSITFAPTAPMATFIVKNTNDSGPDSLRQAIINANDSAGLDSISFSIPGSGVHTINVLNTFLINTPMIIDGYTQPGASMNNLANGDNAVILIELNGASAPSGGLHIQNNAGGSTIRGLVINRFLDNGIFLFSVSNNIIEGNFIGTNAIGLTGLGNANHGVNIASAAMNNTVGGTVPAARNVISGNRSGVDIFGNSSTGNKIQGNFIGTNATGTVDVGNTSDGVLTQSTPNNTIGGTAAGARNVISGNNASGIQMFGSASTGNLVQGNFIGINVTGTAALGNTNNGIDLGGASGNTIGGTVVAARNIISGNAQNGIFMDGVSSNNQIQGNFIGTNITGTADVGNATAGVLIDISPDTIVGGTVTGARNIISGNNSHGVSILGASSRGTLVQGNFIGTDVNGTAALGNSIDGVFLNFTRDIMIGGASAGAGNVIAFNGARGVHVSSNAGISILSNSIHSNTGLGIDLDPVGVTTNDVGDGDTGANNLQNFPVITSASTTIAQGTLNSTANTTFRIEFFANPTCDSSGNGEGRIVIGATTVTTNGSGNVNFGFTFPSAIAPGQAVTSTASDPNGNTSEFSQCIAVTSPSGGNDTIGVFRPSGNLFFLRNSNSTGSPDISLPFGAAGDLPVVGDWDGNGTTTIGVYRPSTSTFFLRNSNTIGFPDITVSFGDGPNGDIPNAGDWNGDGTWTIGVYRPSTSTFFLRNSNTAGFPDLSIPFGAVGDMPVLGDWDGNGTTTIGLYRASGSVFFLRNTNTTGSPDITVPFGAAGDLPVVGDWDGNGTTTIGVYRPAGSTFFLRNSNTLGFPDITAPFGASGDKPLAGDWNGM